MLPTVCAPLTTVAPSKANLPERLLEPPTGAFCTRSQSTVMPLLHPVRTNDLFEYQANPQGSWVMPDVAGYAI